jgi:hypothetical protein
MNAAAYGPVVLVVLPLAAAITAWRNVSGRRSIGDPLLPNPRVRGYGVCGLLADWKSLGCCAPSVRPVSCNRHVT